MNIITRQEATQQGLSRYYTGSPCKYGHIAERNRASGCCLVCANEKQKKRWKETYKPKPQKRSELIELNKAAIALGKKTFIAPFRCSKGHKPIRKVAKSIGNCRCLTCYKQDLSKGRKERREEKIKRIADVEKSHGKKFLSRKDARKQGKRLYFTGQSCKYGHISENLVACGGCLECRRIYYKENKSAFASRAKLRKFYIKKATPSWVCLERVQTKYKEREAMSALTGLPHHVDHIIPLQGENVCGLHVANNLRVILARDNLRKSNRLEMPRSSTA